MHARAVIAHEIGHNGSPHSRNRFCFKATGGWCIVVLSDPYGVRGMKGLTTLIKLHKRNLDELRRKMVSLENQKVQLLQVSANLDANLREEIKTASKTPEWGQFFGDYSNRIKNRQNDIAREVQKLDKKMEALN